MFFSDLPNLTGTHNTQHPTPNQLSHCDNFNPSQLIKGVLVERPHEIMTGLSREQIEQLVVNTMELETQIVLLLFPPAVAAQVKSYEQQAAALQHNNTGGHRIRHPVILPADVLNAKNLAARFQAFTARWIFATVDRYMPKPQSGFISHIFNKLLFTQDIEAYHGAKVGLFLARKP